VRPLLGANDREILEQSDTIIGIDEVGRGCLAGPVVVCGVCFATIPENPAIQDSKIMSSRQREQAAAWLIAHSQRWLIIEVWVEIIDRINILQATRTAMRAALRSLAGPGCSAVVDQVELGESVCPVFARSRADASYFCVAAASILAKVHRDRLMARLACSHPHWGWQRNRGYGTREHRLALQEYGSSLFHRKSFRWSPVLP
jgi:ribonuclease HII